MKWASMKFVEIRYSFGMSANSIKFTSFKRAVAEWTEMLSENADCAKYHDAEVFDWESDWKGILQPFKNRERSAIINKITDDAQRSLLAKIKDLAKSKAPAGQVASDDEIGKALDELCVSSSDYKRLLLASVYRGEA